MKKVNHIGIVFDRSGSMGGILDEARTGLNDSLRTIAEENGKADNMFTSISFVSFSTQVDEPRTLELGEELKEGDIRASGWTALNDAVGHTIQFLESIPTEENEDVAYVVIIVTDGCENGSKEFNSSQIANMIKERNGLENWTFTFMGVGENVFETAKTLNISYKNTTTWEPEAGEVFSSLSTQNNSGFTKFYSARSGGGTQSRNFYNG